MVSLARTAWFCFTFFHFLGLKGGAMAQWPLLPRYASDLDQKHGKLCYVLCSYFLTRFSETELNVGAGLPEARIGVW